MVVSLPEVPVSVRRRTWQLVLGATLLVATIAHLKAPAGSWHYFNTGARMLVDVHSTGGGLHLYHAHPDIQIGPLTLLVALPFTVLPMAAAKTLAVVAMSAGAVVVVRAAASLLPAEHRGRVVLPALLFLPVWEELAGRAGHLDDVIAICLTAVALPRLRDGRVLSAAALIALAADAKPWALAFVVLLLVAPARHRLTVFGVWAAVVAVAWLPFVLADPASVVAATFRIHNAAGSALRALGVTDPLTPSWCRPAQLVLGAAIGWLVWVRRRPVAIVFAVIAARLLLDPATWSYYTAGLLAGAVLVDLSLPGRRPLPWFTFGAFVLVYLPTYVHVGPLADEAVHGYLRAAYLLTSLVAITSLPMRDLLDRSAPDRVTWTDAEPAIS